MSDRDYLIRLINQAAQALGSALGLRQQQKQQEALDLLDDFLGRELRLRARLALGLSDRDLLAMLSVGGVPNGESVAIMAAFLQEEGELYAELGRLSESLPRYEKALRLNLYLLRNYGEIEGWDVPGRTDRLLRELSPYRLEAETRRALWQWHEESGRLAEAENELYELKREGGAVPEDGIRFYDRLEALDDEALQRGGLTRDELAEGREQWRLLTGETAKND